VTSPTLLFNGSSLVYRIASNLSHCIIRCPFLPQNMNDVYLTERCEAYRGGFSSYVRACLPQNHPFGSLLGISYFILIRLRILSFGRPWAEAFFSIAGDAELTPTCGSSIHRCCSGTWPTNTGAAREAGKRPYDIAVSRTLVCAKRHP